MFISRHNCWTYSGIIHLKKCLGVSLLLIPIPVLKFSFHVISPGHIYCIYHVFYTELPHSVFTGNPADSTGCPSPTYTQLLSQNGTASTLLGSHIISGIYIIVICFNLAPITRNVTEATKRM